MATARNQRRGVILIVVLGLLTIFTLMALTFVVVARQGNRAATAAARMETVGDPPDKLCDIAFLQAVRGTTNPRSVIGPHGLLVAQTGIAGSVSVGHHVTMGGQVGVAGHLRIGDNVTIAAKAGVMSDVDDQTILMGIPAMPTSQARRVYTIFMQLPEVVARLKQLEQQVEELAEDAGGGAPDDVVAEAVGVGGELATAVLALLGLDVRVVAEVRERHLEDLGDLDLAVGEGVRAGSRDAADEGADEKVGDGDHQRCFPF